MVINKTFFQGFFSPLLEDFAYKPGTFSPRWSGTLSIIYLSDFLGARCELSAPKLTILEQSPMNDSHIRH